ncbi:MAG: GDP-mannose 4,6-dehydratase [Candidatus Taylorbacteria bacterium]|nr:GDP-mannose 4,6-dehydratase [Candidatus Taylorbacteria bacterium]
MKTARATKNTKKVKRAFITGITGQDGSYLTELLLKKGYEVHGLIRRVSTFNTGRIEHLYQDPHIRGTRLFLHYGDLSDASNIKKLIFTLEPDEIYNLAAQSHVKVSFDMAEYTGNITGLGVFRVLEAIRDYQKQTGKKVKFYQASSSEMFGSAPPPQNENTKFAPRSPYGVSKAAAYYATINYRESYGLFAVNGILFNHESPRRGETFVSRKITSAVAKIKLGLQNKLYLGNLEARRDWGHAQDYVEAMYLMLQQPKPKDYVIGTGRQHSVRQLCELAFKQIGVTLKWRGAGQNEKGVDAKTGDVLVAIDLNYFRPAEVNSLRADPRKASKELGWKPKIKFHELIKEMVTADIESTLRSELAKGGIKKA